MGAVACKSGPDPKVAQVTAGTMPEGRSWRGVYYSQVYGNLHLIEEDGTIEGRWRTVAGDSWGELHGKADGDLLRYEWVEHKIGLVGPSSTRRGRGYFQYKVMATADSPKEPDQISGQWGLNDAEAGNGWEATKQVNQEPDPDSVRPDEVENQSAVSSGGWDEGEKGQKSEGSEGSEGSSE